MLAVLIWKAGEGNRRVSSLEDRIRVLEDRAAIQDLVAVYFKATDDDDYAVMAHCFTRDARFEASGFEDAAGRDGGHAGRRLLGEHHGAAA